MKIDLYIFFGVFITGISIYMEWYCFPKDPIMVIVFGLLALNGLIFIMHGFEKYL